MYKFSRFRLFSVVFVCFHLFLLIGPPDVFLVIIDSNLDIIESLAIIDSNLAIIDSVLARILAKSGLN